MPIDAGNITVSVGVALGVAGTLVRALAPAWIEQQVRNSPAVKALEGRLANAEAIHGDLREMKGTMQVLADNSVEAVRVTRELATVLTEVQQRVAVVEAVAPSGPKRRAR